MRRLTPASIAVASCLVIAVAFAADDPFTASATDPVNWQNAIVNVARGSFSPPQITAALRAMPGEQRATWVRTLGGWARTYTASEEFQKRYKKTYKEWKKSHGGGGGGFGLGGLKQKLAASAEKNATDQALGAEDPAAADRWTMDEDAAATLHRRLTLFLAVSKDVDFEAAVSNGRFADAANEAKPAEWKMCYRAGPEATVAAREVAASWLADLDAAQAATDRAKAK